MKKKHIYISVLIVLIIGISFGYALLSADLNINGTSSIHNASWDIHFENIQVASGSVTASTPTLDSLRTTVSFSVFLENPGDFYEFTIDAKNDGSMDGMISTFVSKLNGTEITSLPVYLEYYVTYADGLEIASNQLLAANTKETYKIYVGYKKDIQANQLPANIQDLNLSFNVTYVQATSAAQAVNHAVGVYTINLSDGNSNIIQIGQPIPSGITQYSNGADALAAFRLATGDNTIQFYLKHTVQNGIVTESFVEFVLTPELALANPGVTAGTYDIQGAGSTFNEQENSYNSIYFESNKATVISAFGIDSCPYEFTSGSYKEIQCAIPNLSVYVFSPGTVAMVNNSWRCDANTDGTSYCSTYDF